MPKLSQCLGVERKTRTRVHRDVTALYRKVQQRDNFSGFNRTYIPVDDDGEELPPEQKLVQHKVDEVLADLRSLETELLDVVATKDFGNTTATADVVVDGVVILEAVPVTFLLFLEKRLDDLYTFFTGLPVLDPNESWEMDRSDGLYRSEIPTSTHRYKKVPHAHELAPATEHHPAQVETYYEDVHIGTWTRILRSGAAPPVRIDNLCTRVVRLRDAVIRAREAANATDVDEIKLGSTVFEFLLG